METPTKTIEPASPEKGRTNIVQRILTAAVGIPVVLGLIYLGGWPFVIGVLAIALAAQYEFYKVAPVQMDLRHVLAGLAGGGLIVLYQAGFEYLLDLAVFAFILLLVYDTFDRTGGNVWQQTVWMAAGIIYPTLLFSYAIRIRAGWAGLSETQTIALVMTPLILVWTTDSLAYFVGRSLGKRPLAPAISPKKTWEGTFGGLAGALLAAAVLKLTLLDFIAWMHVLAFALIAGIGGQIGDLIESRLKRLFGVKDSGAILPGHGGVLDRIDSLLLVVPVYGLYLEYVVW